MATTLPRPTAKRWHSPTLRQRAEPLNSEVDQFIAKYQEIRTAIQESHLKELGDPFTHPEGPLTLRRFQADRTALVQCELPLRERLGSFIYDELVEAGKEIPRAVERLANVKIQVDVLLQGIGFSPGATTVILEHPYVKEAQIRLDDVRRDEAAARAALRQNEVDSWAALRKLRGVEANNPELQAKGAAAIGV